VFFGLLTVALVVLWVRSYKRLDIVSNNSYDFLLNSSNGYVLLSRSGSSGLPGKIDGWNVSTLEAESDLVVPPSFYWKRSNDFYVVSPHWVPLSMTAVAAVLVASIPAPLIRSFSLRTLLIATTLVATMLGLGVWLAF
jgi:hypothetical protein